MRFKGPEKSSILLLGRNTVVIGAVVIIAVSFVFGYFFGYKGAGTQESGKQESSPAPVASKGAVSPEEKKILESPDNSPVLPPDIKPTEFPKETANQKAAVPPSPDKPSERASGSKGSGPAIAGNETDSKADVEQPSEEKSVDNAKAGNAGAEPKAGTKKVKKKSGAPKAKPSKTAKEPKEATDAKGIYSVQVGAFPSKEGAIQLQKSLQEKKIKAYIVNTGEGDPYYRVRVGTFRNKKDAEQMSELLRKRDGLSNFVAK